MTNTHFVKNESGSSTKMTLKSHKLLTGAIALVFAAGLVSPAFALTIDTMDTCSNHPDWPPTFQLTADSGTTSDSFLCNGSDLEAIQDYRFVEAIWQSGSNDVMAQMNDGDGYLGLSSDILTDGDFYIRYFAGGAGLGGVDFTAGGGDRVVIDLIAADLGSDFTVTITDTEGNEASETQMTSGGAETLEFEFVNFVPVGDPVDFSSVDKLEINLDGVVNGDYAIDLIGVPQTKIGGTVGSMSTTTLLVAGAQSNMGLWSLALVGAVAVGAAVTYKVKSKKSEQ